MVTDIIPRDLQLSVQIHNKEMNLKFAVSYVIINMYERFK